MSEVAAGPSREADEPAPLGLPDRALQSAVRDESTAFGFSIMITITFGVLQRVHGTAEIGDLFMFGLGAVGSFTAIEALASRGFHRPVRHHGSIVLTLGTALNFISVLAAAAAALGVGSLVETDVAWLAGPLVAATVYLACEAAELAFAERVQRARGDEDAAHMRD